MQGIEYITDEKGARRKVVIDLKKHKTIWADIQDALVANARRKEKNIPLAKVKASLAKKRKKGG